MNIFSMIWGFIKVLLGFKKTTKRAMEDAALAKGAKDAGITEGQVIVHTDAYLDKIQQIETKRKEEQVKKEPITPNVVEEANKWLKEHTKMP